MLKNISNFRSKFIISIALITFLTNAAVAMPNKIYSQPFPFVPSSNIKNANNNAVILTFDDGLRANILMLSQF